jgi:predicted transcriptional regulator
MLPRVPGWLRRARDPLAFGPLEREVMEVVWRGGEFAVRDVQTALVRDVAYTTVMTTLDRLYKKGFVSRRSEGRAFVYTAAATRAEVAVRFTSGLLQDLLADGSATPRPFLSNLVDAVSAGDHRMLDELERLVRDKRQQLRKEPR